MKFISLFAGIGGFDLGFERAWMKCVAQVEKDPFCLRVLAKHWPDVERFEDVREFGKHNAPTADLVCGGFPCQPHSLAGKRKGAADDRDLWPEYRGVIGELKPTWVVGENVPGIRTTILDQVLSDLEGMDYTTRTLVVPACAFDAPHRRERIFIIAYSNRSWKSPSGEDRGVGGKRESISEDMADTERQRLEVGKRNQTPGWSRIQSTRSSEQSLLEENMVNTRSNGVALIGQQSEGTGEHGNGRGVPPTDGGKFWAVEPPVGRVADGVPRRVDRLRSLGNAVVPQVAEWIGRRIMEVA